MTNPTNQSNGASLEDCHTNFFALTDLCGIKWRKVVWGEWNDGSNGADGTMLEDPVLAGYVRCLAADILCVWRRVSASRPPPETQAPGLFDQLGLPPPPPPAPHQHPPLSLHTAKELWIFWYGDAPDLTNLIPADLLSNNDGEQGSWENGLSYECRSLLFKALHNLIERCLLSRDFVRLGKWFVQPYDSNDKILEKSGHLSFAFDFFVHGESQVCASVDVRQHPAVRTLLASHIQQAQANVHSSPPVHVILAPFGLAGTLTGQSLRSIDPLAQRLLESWRHFYPIEKCLENPDIPPIVEVVVGGVKMHYPSCYVLITDLDESTAALVAGTQTAPAAPIAHARANARGAVLAERVWHESCICAQEEPAHAGLLPNAPSAGQAGSWNVVDPTRRLPCSCSCKLSLGTGMTGGGTDSVPLPSVGSPASVAASPATGVAGPPDPPMPTLSPQPPQPALLDTKPAPTPTDFSAPKSVSSMSNQMLSPYGGEIGKCLSAEGGKGTPPGRPRAPSPPTQAPPPTTTVLKRPNLSALEYDDPSQSEIQHSSLLYDYSTLDAWLNHPVKRLKQQPPTPMQHEVAPSPQLQTVFKQEATPAQSPGNVSVDGFGGGPGDPYDFDEDMAGRMDFKRQPMAAIKQEEDSKNLINGSLPTQTKMANENLFTSEGLAVSFNDLDRIFEHTDEPTFDAVPTPPSSNKPDELAGAGAGAAAVLAGLGGRCALRPEELSKMFPTPPSLEHHPATSPQTVLEPLMRDPASSPNHEPITDWSYVYKPPELSMFVGSTKYAPVTELPSLSLPPVVLPSDASYKPSWATYQDSSSKPQLQQRSGGSSNSGSSAGPASSGNASCGRTSLTPVPAGTPLSNMPGLDCRPGWGQSQLLRHPPPYSPAQPPPHYPKPEPPPHHSPPLPEADALIVTVLLTDSALNIFRDHNFDSCTLCVCNSGMKVAGNIRGSDAGVYLSFSGGAGGGSPFMSPSPHQLATDDDPVRCTCGFSAVVNRRLSHKAGLFAEDELEITGVTDDVIDREGSQLTASVMETLRDQCVGCGSSSSAIIRAATHYRPLTPVPGLNVLALRDGAALSALALDHARLVCVPSSCKMEMDASSCMGARSGVHRWGYLRARGPPSNQDIIRVMKQLQPLLQDAIQKKCGNKLWEAPIVSGPLTWRQFHRLAGRGTEDRCGPQPIPPLLVGRDKDWLSLAPYALHLWDRLLLEPYSYARDIAYFVVAPESEFVISRVKSFFKELSSMYEMCRFGRHCPITKNLRDGILRVGKAASTNLANQPMDDWFHMLHDSNTANMFKLYAQVCKHYLVTQLNQLTLDKTLFESSSNSPSASSGNSSGGSGSERGEDGKEETSEGENTTPPAAAAAATPSHHADDDDSIPQIVIYLVEPFTIGTDNTELQKLSCIAMLRIFQSVVENVPENIRSNIQLQIISLESIAELGRTGDTERRSNHMRALALSIFSQCRRTMQHTTTVKALTGFGTAASNEIFLNSKDEKNKKAYRIFQPAYVLAPKMRPPVGSSEEGSAAALADRCGVLYVAYCLSEDQRWLLACATDDCGHLLETIAVNVHVPNRSRRRKASPRRHALSKLMDFILGVMSKSVIPWRLVVGRVGRIGHGELKGWSWLLSRKQLLKASKQLKDMCAQCAVLYPSDVPCILSACLVSLEADQALRLMPDQVTPDERFQSSTKCHLSTPGDVTATHILVFPTSATTQSSQSAFQETNLNAELGDEELLLDLNDAMAEDMGDFNDLFAWTEGDAGGGGGSPTRGGRSAPASPTQQRAPGGPTAHSPYGSAGASGAPPGEEVGNLLQQPLALGFLVSTAPTGRMPRWFWSSCPHLEAVCPAFLKNALHLHCASIQQNADDQLLQSQATSCHPLDSQFTTDVLRYVLEGYNALSWLALDSNTHDRQSCLPIHMQVLMQLYHMTSALT